MSDKDFVFIEPHDPRRPRAERYAQAVSQAAAANERIKALEDALMVSEYRREEAETQLQGLEWDPVLGKVFTQADEEPGDHAFILDLYNGGLWERMDGAVREDEHWKQLTGDRYGSTAGWPLEGGPFVAFPDDWSLKRILEQAEGMLNELDGIQNALRDEDGYPDPEASSKWARPRSLSVATKRVLESYRLRLAEAKEAARQSQSDADAKIKEAASKRDEMREELEVAFGSKAIKALVDVMKSTPWNEQASIHGLVKGAELQMLQDIEVPEDGGDPIYKPGPLLAAAALLVRAADSLADDEKEVKDDD